MAARGGIAARFQIDGCRQHVRRVQATIHRLRVSEAANEKPGNDQQQYGHGHLRDQKCRSQPAVPGTTCPDSFESVDQVDPGNGQCGHHAERQSCHHADDRGEREHANVEPEIDEQGNRRRDAHRHQEPCRPEGDADRPGGPGHRQDEIFGEQLSNQPAATGAERLPERDLDVASGRSRQYEVRDVDADDQQDERTEGHERGREYRDGLRSLRMQHRAPVHRHCRLRAFGLARLGAQLASNRVEIDLRACASDARSESAGQMKTHRLETRALVKRRSQQRVGRQRYPEVSHERRQDTSEAIRSDTDDRERLPVEPDRSADGIGRCGEPALPEGVRENNRRLRLRPIVSRRKQPAERGCDAEDGKVVPAHDFAEGMFDVGIDPQPERLPLKCRQPDEGRVAVAQLDVLAVAHVGIAVGVDAHNFARIGYRQRSQENRVCQAEDGRVDADAQGEDRHRHQGEARRSGQSPEAVTKILDEVRHDCYIRSSAEKVRSTTPRNPLRSSHRDEHPAVSGAR